ncbi:MAG TPA: Uma2 family endonuclease [Ktedonobacteraceae bacterium]|nr:Uma2 family endonuclease [Ktedonobacteraceae bacterium]
MTALPNRPHMSVEEYFQLERDNRETRYEYIDGIVTMLLHHQRQHRKHPTSPIKSASLSCL